MQRLLIGRFLAKLIMPRPPEATCAVRTLVCIRTYLSYRVYHREFPRFREDHRALKCSVNRYENPKVFLIQADEEDPHRVWGIPLNLDPKPKKIPNPRP